MTRLAKIRLIRQDHATFDAAFFERSDDFWPIARAASTFRSRDDWPDVTRYGDAFGVAPPPVRFDLAPLRRRRAPGPIVRADLYDAVIVRRRSVPTRARMWHDFLNAMVWASFPRAKLALHTRQHEAIERWIPEGATQLPNARTRELDALALVDEGGVLLLDLPSGPRAILFGHALFEGLVLGRPAMISRAVVLGRTDASDPEALLAEADARLSDILLDRGRIVAPEELPRISLDSPEATRSSEHPWALLL